MKTKNYLLACIFLTSFFSQSFAQLQVDSTVTTEEMVETFIGPGVNFSNAQYTGAQVARGIFSNGDSTNLGVDQGIALTSGQIAIIIGPNSHTSAGFHNGTPGDNLLETYITSSTYDASVLEFDFVPASDTAWCMYVFGSEEYNEWVGSSFNDIFGFFVNGPQPGGGNYENENIALVPGTELPVAINSVNLGYSSPGEPPPGPGVNGEFFVDNTGGLTIEYDGFTVPLEAKVAVIPGETYHFKLAIADAGDGIYDSGVLLESGSFKSQGSADFLSFGFSAILNPALTEDVYGLIENDVITLQLPFGTEVTNLIASFETPGGVVVNLNGEEQVSGVTPNDFSQTLNYFLSGRNEKYWQIIVDFSTGITSRELNQVYIYPNPAVGSFKLNNVNTINVSIYNLIGTELMNSPASEHGSDLVVDNLHPGIYFIELQKEGMKETRKIIVN